MRQVAARVQRWFADHAGDGEFDVSQKPLEIPPGSAGSGAVRCLYTTKPAVLGRGRCSAWASLTSGPVLGKYGLPSHADLRLLSEWLGTGSLDFLGDLDSPDLLIFAWLRDQLGSHRCRYAGLSDTLLQEDFDDLARQAAIALTDAERAAWTLVQEVLLDSRELLGNDCWSLLEKGFKLELESIRGASTSS